MFPADFLSLEVLLPFFLVLAIIFGALEISQVFGNKAVKGIIAIVFAFFAVMNSQVVTFINFILPYAAGFFVVLFLIWIILKPLRGGGGKGPDPLIIIVILVLLMLIFARLSETGYFPSYGIFTDSNILWGFGIIIVIFVIYKAYKMGA